jgi:hypothetical protein
MGYYGGDPDRVRAARVDDVMSILSYEDFISDYELTFQHINEE